MSPYRGLFGCLHRSGVSPVPDPFACNLTSWYSDTLFRVADHFTMRRHNTTRRSNFKRREQIGCKTVHDGSNSLPTNQLPRTIVWSSPRIPRASSAGWMQLVGVAPSPAAHSHEQCWCIWAGPGCPSLGRCPANDGRLPPRPPTEATMAGLSRTCSQIGAHFDPRRLALRFGDAAASTSLMRTNDSFLLSTVLSAPRWRRRRRRRAI